MKNIFKVVLLSGVFSITSCSNDLLTPFAPGTLEESVAIQNSSDLNRLMMTAYAYTPSSEIQFSSAFTDEVRKGNSNTGTGVNGELAFFVNASSSAPASIWNSHYGKLAYINRVIKFADLIVPSSANDLKVIQDLKAQALTMRAYSHIQLISFFSMNPKDRNALGVMHSNAVFPTTTQLGRATNGEIYDQIDKDLNDAVSLFTTSGVPFTASYANKNFALAMKARAYALQGDYVNALVFADKVIAESGVSLATASNYKAVFHTDNNSLTTEVLFKLERTAVDSKIGQLWSSNNSTVTGTAYYEIGTSLLSIIPTTDIRYSTILRDPSGLTLNPTIYPVGKHPGYSVSFPLLNDVKLSRISEMYFIKAEALVSQNDLSGAAAVIKTILDKRFATAQTLPVYADATAAWKDILKQRRIEFAFEGYRYIDLKRLGQLANEGVLRDANDFSFNGQVSLPTTDYRFTLPIPVSETNANKVIRNQQNNDY